MASCAPLAPDRPRGLGAQRGLDGAHGPGDGAHGRCGWQWRWMRAECARASSPSVSRGTGAFSVVRDSSAYLRGGEAASDVAVAAPAATLPFHTSLRCCDRTTRGAMPRPKPGPRENANAFNRELKNVENTRLARLPCFPTRRAVVRITHIAACRAAQLKLHGASRQLPLVPAVLGRAIPLPRLRPRSEPSGSRRSRTTLADWRAGKWARRCLRIHQDAPACAEGSRHRP